MAPGFEQHEAVFLEDRHLPEGLECAVIRFILIALFEETGFVGQAGFLQRPARAQIAHLALGKLRDPFESGDGDHAMRSFAFSRRAANGCSRRASFDGKKMAFQLVDRSGPAFLVAAASLLIVQTRMCKDEFGPLGNGTKPDLDE